MIDSRFLEEVLGEKDWGMNSAVVWHSGWIEFPWDSRREVPTLAETLQSSYGYLEQMPTSSLNVAKFGPHICIEAALNQLNNHMG